ncbi:cupin domain-containing protein [Kocuria sp. JC486]|uniref:Cupin domain-containing protein n=1 Tax=Kocuria soli TaxID=2485125 RepID=A0A3N4A9Z6_9MICC|nr:MULTISPECIES: cupin domain-containing protein [Kocuria]NHU85172.1 cupin domain-containing protein [Kocuria sp. JC486]ROZ62498.1 cupin domain-containing protein [Kocuria soli]
MERFNNHQTGQGPAERFVGDVYVDGIVSEPGTSKLTAAHVRFAPGARTNWHTHTLGQSLYCTDGVGVVVNRAGEVMVLRAGETVWAAEDEEHWHGALDDRFMAHVAMLESVDDTDPTTWLEPVDDDEYARAMAVAKKELGWA